MKLCERSDEPTLGRRVSESASRTPIAFMLPNLEVGGAQRATLRICRRLDRTRFQPRLVTVHRPGWDGRPDTSQAFRAAGIPIWSLDLEARADQSLPALLKGARRLRQVLRTGSLKIIDSCLFEASMLGRIASVGTSVLHVTHLVNTPYSEQVTQSSSFLTTELVRQLDGVGSRVDAGLVAITETVARTMRQDLRLPDDRITVIPRGIDTEEFARLPPPPPSDSLRILALGRLSPQKDHATLIEALGRLRRAGVGARLTIAGSGPLKDELRRRIRAQGLEEPVIRLLPPTRDIRTLHENHDVFCFPSRWEGLGNAILEAMAFGRPIVASDLPVLREVIGSDAWYASPGDSAGFAESLACVAALTPEERHCVGTRMRDRVVRRYGLVDQVEVLMDYYDRLLAEDSGAS